MEKMHPEKWFITEIAKELPNLRAGKIELNEAELRDSYKLSFMNQL